MPALFLFAQLDRATGEFLTQVQSVYLWQQSQNNHWCAHQPECLNALAKNRIQKITVCHKSSSITHNI